MEWTLWIVGWLVIGIVTFIVLWKWFDINWSAEAAGTKLTMVITPVLWPFVLLFIAIFWVQSKMK